MGQRTVNLILPMPPSTNHYWGLAVSKKGRPFLYLTQEARAYKALIKDIAGLETLIYSEVSVTLKVFRARRAGDLENREKVLLDALQETVYANDRQIVEKHSYRFEDPKRPRVEVEIQAFGLC